MSTPATKSVPVPTRVHVNIEIHTIGGQDRAFVDSPHVRIGERSTQVPSVRWENRTRGKATLWFPNGGEVFDERPEGFSNPIDIPEKGLELKVKEHPEKGNYHYHVYCEVVKDCAQGHSEPRLDVP